MYLRLTCEETKSLEENHCAYVIRDSVVYLIEEKGLNYMVTVFNSPIKIVKNYQLEL